MMPWCFWFVIGRHVAAFSAVLAFDAALFLSSSFLIEDLSILEDEVFATL